VHSPSRRELCSRTLSTPASPAPCERRRVWGASRRLAERAAAGCRAPPARTLRARSRCCSWESARARSAMQGHSCWTSGALLTGALCCRAQIGLGSSTPGCPHAQPGSPAYSDAKVANRTSDFGWEMSSRGRFAAPADFPLHNCSPNSHVHVRRESLGFVHRSRAIFCRPVLRFATFASPSALR
jgi:hypothetical protein